MLIAVRHAMPAFDPRTPPDTWPLTDDGRATAQALAGVLPADSRLVASGELKARQTLEPSGPVVVDPRFNEVARVEPRDGDFRRRRREYVEGVDHTGWEPRTQLAARFEAALADHLALAERRPLIIATHGMALTIWLTARTGLPHPGVFWSDLRFPDALRVDLAEKTITRIQ